MLFKWRVNMKNLVNSYSLTGNNEALAKSVAEEFAAVCINIAELKHKTMGSIGVCCVRESLKPVLDDKEELVKIHGVSVNAGDYRPIKIL
jgi:hypothetical protein